MSSKNILVVGSGGRLGQAVAREWGGQHRIEGWNRAQVDLARSESLQRVLAEADFDLLINCAALTSVDYAESHPDEARAINATAPQIMAQACADRKVRMIHISTDYVFDGKASQPYEIEDVPNPLSVYGQSKFDGEQGVLAASDHHIIVRVAWVFGPDRPSFIDMILDRAASQEKVEAVADKFSSPSYAPEMARELLKLVDDGIPGGTCHLCNDGVCSWQDYGQEALDEALRLGLPMKTRKVSPVPLASLSAFVAVRPVYSALSTVKTQQKTGMQMKPWQQAVRQYVALRAAFPVS